LHSDKEIRKIARHLGLGYYTALVRESIKIDGSYHRECNDLRKVNSLKGAIEHYNKVKTDAKRDLPTKLAIKKVCQFWPESNQKTIKKGRWT